MRAARFGPVKPAGRTVDALLRTNAPPLTPRSSFDEYSFRHLGIRFMVVNADGGEVVGVNPLECSRDVDLELEAVKPVRGVERSERKNWKCGGSAVEAACR